MRRIETPDPQEVEQATMLDWIEAFHRDRSRPDGLHPYCKMCVKRVVRAWEATHREQKAAQYQRWKARRQVRATPNGSGQE